MTSRRSRNSAAATATGRGLSPQSLYNTHIYIYICLSVLYWLANSNGYRLEQVSSTGWLSACLVAFNDCILGVMIIYMDSSDSVCGLVR